MHIPFDGEALTTKIGGTRFLRVPDGIHKDLLVQVVAGDQSLLELPNGLTYVKWSLR